MNNHIKCKTRLMMFLAIICSIYLTGLVRADQAAVAFDTTQYWTTGGGIGVYGWQFRAHATIKVSALGLYDNRFALDGGVVGDGLAEPHYLGIWDVSNHATPLAVGFLDVGTGAELIDGFRYVGITPTTLPANHDYVIAAVYPNDDFTYKDQTTGLINNPSMVITFGSELEFGGYRSGATDLLLYPDNLAPDDVYGFGPNFRYVVVPEPSVIVLFGMALTMLVRSRSCE